jgi:hypothetical protein
VEELENSCPQRMIQKLKPVMKAPQERVRWKKMESGE